MAGSRWVQGKFKPNFPNKYKGDASNIKFRSSWELALMHFLDRTPEILQWESEETVIQYFDPARIDEFGKPKPRRYFMDFKAVVKKADGRIRTILIEVKPYKQTIKPRVMKSKSEKTNREEYLTWLTNDAKWKAARELCRQRDWEFVIITDKVLFAGIDKGYKPPKKKRFPP
jgi:hypothetical protein